VELADDFVDSVHVVDAVNGFLLGAMNGLQAKFQLYPEIGTGVKKGIIDEFKAALQGQPAGECSVCKAV